MARALQVFGKDACLHEKAVVAAAEYKRPRRRQNLRAVRKEPVIVRLDLRMHLPEVKETALRLADGELKRIEQVGPNDLIVHNDTKWRYKK